MSNDPDHRLPVIYFTSRIRRQIDLALSAIDALEPDLRPGIDVATRVQRQIRRIRGAGSRDRRFYRELIFTWFRYREWIDPLRQTDPALAGLRLIWLANGTKELSPAKDTLPAPFLLAPTSAPAEAAASLESFSPGVATSLNSLVPEWLADEFPPETTQTPHLLERPPIGIRTLPDSVTHTAQRLREHGIVASIHPEIPGALSVPTDSNLKTAGGVESGYFEIQDLSSQAVLHQVVPQIGEHWFDACAGTGGKSLQLAEWVGESGRVTVTDKRPDALITLRIRARRAGRGNLIVLEPRNAAAAEIRYDAVLVDAPCSGTGTWRRRPFLRHQTNLEVLERHSRRQLEILSNSAARVKTGGRLIYVTCSLCRSENQHVIEQFLTHHGDFCPDPVPNILNLTERAPGQFLILPERFNGDGFFLATLRRK